MNAAAMSTPRTMMREELALGIRDVEARLTRIMEDNFGRLHTQIGSEREECKQLEDRVRHLEQKVPIPPDGSIDELDKPIAVVGGFGDRFVEQTENLLKELLVQAEGFQSLAMTEGGIKRCPCANGNVFHITSVQRRPPCGMASSYNCMW